MKSVKLLRLVLFLLLALLLLSFSSCTAPCGGEGDGGESALAGDKSGDGEVTEEDCLGGINNNGAVKSDAKSGQKGDVSGSVCESDGKGTVNSPSDSFIMKCRVIEVGEVIEAEVIEAEYASGIYWIIFSEETEVRGAFGERLSVSDIKAGDTVTVSYGGQVMMSYPPRISAIKIDIEL